MNETYVGLKQVRKFLNSVQDIMWTCKVCKCKFTPNIVECPICKDEERT